ncbi:MAG: aromatic acid/H+ symport family MFS transporter [Candidatus Pseudomonas phytovorans]|uniref:Aromatic acid/H+ symport family MFS transporter n=1 Tax=Candidatus Pseudomonas phytovorans TaxID=3121377 RepID=A0AAJ5WB56_9PSED|nr:aromatic acid/H+ symport family MFS transporter [Pseudomonas sp.]WEK28496.1 MAG: aromatic acid/H+ symport family MFS transporter [Pseudomonas sp.]
MNNQIEAFRAALDQRSLSRYQIQTLVLLVLLLICDGYDAQLLGFVVPTLAQEWETPKAAFGIVFTCNLLGLTVGSLLLTPLADRFGIRKTLLSCVLLFSGLTLLSAWADDIYTLAAIRFLCGIGMGGAMPSAMALMADYSPPRMKTFFVTMAAAGFAFGGAVGGFIAASIMQVYGWHSIFIVGGVAPLLLMPLLYLWLPESLSRLFRTKHMAAALANMLDKYLPQWTPPAPISENGKPQKVAIVDLFRYGYLKPTIFIWGSCIASFTVLYFTVSWLPTLLRDTGFSSSAASLTTSAFLASGTLGAVTLSYLADKVKSKVWLVGKVMVVCGIATACVGLEHGNATLTVLAVMVAGFCLIGGSLTLNGVISNFYPPHIRATGVGWALGVGRLGAIAGPLVGATLIAIHIPFVGIMFLAAIPAVLSGIFAINIAHPNAVPSDNSEKALGYQVPKTSKN